MVLSTPVSGNHPNPTPDKNFRKKAPRFTGIRILKQNAWEALVGFICSSNNNIARISQMVSILRHPVESSLMLNQMDKLCIHYGPLIAHLDGTSYHDMPPPTALTNASVEAHLRDLGFGYRAKYLHQTALAICEQSSDWLDTLRNPESPLLHQSSSHAGEMLPGGRSGYRAAHEALLSLQGVGPKVADCVCLMGLGWGEAVPVDTHVWQIATRDYGFGKGKYRSLTKATYDAVGDCFRKLWGQEAGWAHSVLFAADLRAFADKAKGELKAEVMQDGELKAIVKSEIVKDAEGKDEAIGPAHLLPTPQESPAPAKAKAKAKIKAGQQSTPSAVLRETVVKTESPDAKPSKKRRIVVERPARSLKRELPADGSVEKDAKRPAFGRRWSQRLGNSAKR